MKPSRYVLDSSVALSWCFEDESTTETSTLLKAMGKGEWEALVPPLWPYEMVNVLLGAVRRKRITEAQMQSFIGNILRLPIQAVEQDMELIFRRLEPLATQHDLTAYDTAYLELALSEGLPIATKDDALRKAATVAGVPLVTTALLRH